MMAKEKNTTVPTRATTTDAEHGGSALATIIRQNEIVVERKSAYEEAKAESTAMLDAWKQSVTDLTDIIAECARPTLFIDKTEGDKEVLA